MSDEVAAPSEVRDDRDRLASAFVLSAGFAILLWLVMIVESVSGVDLVAFGVYPGSPAGLVGILVAPFIHASATHLLANTLPIVILGTALLYGYPRAARIVLPALFLGSGLGVWLFGRASYHIGASGLTVGMMFFVFVVGALRWDRRAIGLACIVFFLYGGMVWGVFPGDPQISHESHLAGAVTGTVLALLLRGMDPLPPRKRYSWEQEDAGRAARTASVYDLADYAVHVPAVTLPLSPAAPVAGAPDHAGIAYMVPMDFDAFRRSLAQPAAPHGLSPALQALWHLGRHEWEAAHALVQEHDDSDSAWVHAHLHRVEGDLSNARYWYRRAQQPESRASLDAEWEALAAALLAGARA